MLFVTVDNLNLYVFVSPHVYIMFVYFFSKRMKFFFVLICFYFLSTLDDILHYFIL